MKFSFSIGAIQMALGSLISIKKKLGEKDLSWVADLGWLVAVVAMYLLSLYLVIGESIPIKPVFALIAVAFALVVLFGGMAPDRTVGQGIKAGLADSFTVFLNTISCFGNVNELHPSVRSRNGRPCHLSELQRNCGRIPWTAYDPWRCSRTYRTWSEYYHVLPVSCSTRRQT